MQVASTSITIPMLECLAERLALLLEQEGWPLSDLHAGHVLAFAVSDLDAIISG